MKANFEGFTFPGLAIFGDSKAHTKIRGARPSVIFQQGGDFSDANFLLDAVFDWSVFFRSAGFHHAKFHGIARFDQCEFNSTAWFPEATFINDAWIGQVKFNGYTDFSETKFFSDVSFYGTASKGAFILNSTQFFKVPDFTQCTFQGTPRIDHIVWPGISFITGLTGFHARDLTARYRALRQLASQGQDVENEAKAFKGEVRSRRGSIDKWYFPAFWSGMFYDVFSDFGRSILRPLIAWAFCIVIFAAFFLGENQQIAAKRKRLHLHGIWGQPVAYAKLGYAAYMQDPSPYCYPGNAPVNQEAVQDVQTGFTGLVEKVRNTTNLVNEAFSVAYHNAVIVLDSNGESAHRAFGCLYGVERYGGNPVAFVPRTVAIASGIQKLLSAIFIFFFGLALRNLLKMK